MQQVQTTEDVQGHPMEKGDTVTILTDNTSAKIAEVARDGEEYFVRLRPLHQPYSKGVWHSADRVVWLSTDRKTKREKEKKKAKAAKNNE